MIVLDGSVLVGIIRGEPDAGELLDLLESEECAICAPTLVESRLWCSVNLTTRLSDWLEHFIDTGPGTVVPFSREMADVASEHSGPSAEAADTRHGSISATVWPMPSRRSCVRRCCSKAEISG